jgi:hypothetical protein
MVPAKFMQRAIAVLANAAAESSNLCDKLLARHLLEIVVHFAPPSGWICRCLTLQADRRAASLAAKV